MSWANLYKKRNGSYSGHPVRNRARGVHDLKCEKRNAEQPSCSYPGKLSFKGEGETNTFSGKQS